MKLERVDVHERSGPLGHVRLQGGQQRVEGQRSCCLFLLSLFFWASKRKVKTLFALSRTLKPLGVPLIPA
jgi:hypothetical protein